MKVIKDSATLGEACERFAESPFLTIDTEFMRETTFWPQLCLIQMATPEEEIIVDPLSDGLDLSAFFELMDNSGTVKVFHSARQDIEIIHKMAGIVPRPIFDTQVAAMVCGFGESVGYSMLVKKLVKQDVDKSSRFTDWSRRPLTNKQLQYALGDVTHLRPVYLKLKDQLEASNREPWLDEEMAVLTATKTYEQKPEDAWRRLKMRVKSQISLAVLMELAAWREIQAQSQNVPRSRIVKDDVLYDIANQMPRSLKDLSSLRSIHDGFVRSGKAQDILTAIEQGLERDLSTVPKIPKSRPVQPEAAAIIDLLRVLLKAAAGRYGVATKLIATSDDLEQIALNDDAGVPALKGWRREMFGEDALALKRGELAMTVGGGQIELIRNSSNDSA